MADQAIFTAPTKDGSKVAPTTPIKLPEAFQPQPDPPSREPEMDAFSELEQLDASNPAPDSRPPKKKAEPEKPAQKPAEKAAKPADKPDTSKPAAEKPKEDAAKAKEEPAKETTPESTPENDPTKKFQLASELRREARRLYSENEKLQNEIKQLRKETPAASEDRKALDSKVEALTKRNEELEKEIRYLDYTKSSEFQEKFRKPFAAKQTRIYQQIADLYVRDAEGNERPATNKDFDRVFEASQSDARRVAKELFGEEDFREVLQYRRELMELSQNAEEELTKYREEGQQRSQNKVSEERKMREQAENSFRKSIDYYTEKHPDWFGNIEGDDELNKALQEGFASVDKSQDRSLPLDERVDLLAATRLKAASFGRHILTIKRLKAKVSELETALKEYESSTPGEGEGQRAATIGKTQTDDDGDVNSEIDEIERRNPRV